VIDGAEELQRPSILQMSQVSLDCSVGSVGSRNSSTNDERMHHYQRRRTSITGLML
jgi:hypothetical protein